MVTNDTLSTKAKNIKPERIQVNCRESIFCADKYFLFVINGRRTLLLYEPLQYLPIPGGAIKYFSFAYLKHQIFIPFSGVFRPKTRAYEQRPTKVCKLFRLFFFLVSSRGFETNGDCMNAMQYSKRNANEIFTVTAVQHCSLLSFILLVSRNIYKK